MDQALADDLKRALRVVPDFPRAGILFQDIAPVLRDPALMARAVGAMAAPVQDVDVVAAVEARGFMFGAPIAMLLGAAFVPVRKVGKLPGATLEEKYDLEYGSATIQIQADAIAPGARVLVVDDVLATGGTAAAASRLLSRAGARIAGYSFLLEIAALGGRRALAGDVHAVVAV